MISPCEEHGWTDERRIDGRVVHGSFGLRGNRTGGRCMFQCIPSRHNSNEVRAVAVIFGLVRVP